MIPELERLKTIQYFCGIDDKELKSIAEFIFVRHINKGEIFVYEGQRTNTVYFVVEGLVKVYFTSSQGKEQALDLASQGETINDIAAFDDNPDVASMVTMTPVVLYCVHKEDLKAVILDHPRIGLNALRVVAMRTRRASMLVEELSFDQAINRLSKALLKYSKYKSGENLYYTQQELASVIGTTREMVNKCLKIMKNKSVIRFSRSHIEITNVELLKQIAGLY